MAHTLIKMIGAAYFAVFILDPNGFFMDIVRRTSDDPVRQVANAHTISTSSTVWCSFRLFPCWQGFAG